MTSETPEALAYAFAAAWNAGDAEGIGACFAEDADFVNVVGLWWRKRRDIARAHGYALARYFRDATVEALETRTRTLSGDHAVVHVRWRLTGQVLPDGTPGDPRETVMVFVCERRDGGWIAVAAQNTDVVPDTQTMQARGGTLTPTDYPRGGGG